MWNFPYLRGTSRRCAARDFPYLRGTSVSVRDFPYLCGTHLRRAEPFVSARNLPYLRRTSRRCAEHSESTRNFPNLCGTFRICAEPPDASQCLPILFKTLGKCRGPSEPAWHFSKLCGACRDCGELYVQPRNFPNLLGTHRNSEGNIQICAKHAENERNLLKQSRIFRQCVKCSKRSAVSLSCRAFRGSEETGAGIMEVGDRQVTKVFTVQPSFHHLHSTNRMS